MTQLVEPVNVQQETDRPAPLLLHCGARVVNREEVNAVVTPLPTSTWFPLPHREFVDQVTEQVSQGEFEIQNERHALSGDGARYFGTLSIVSKAAPEAEVPRDYGFVVGLRNSHDKSYPAGLVVGTQVFVCDNLCFSGEIRISRKHTRYAVRDLKALTARAVGQLGARLMGLEERVTAYKQLAIDDREAHDLVIRALDCGAITSTQLPIVVENWRKPKHEEFLPRTGWSLFNAITETYKGINPHLAVARGEALHGLWDQRVGFSRN
jgi:hypothetical protein